jgi:hypothetical protein
LSNVLEGARRSGDRSLNAQLIDTRTDTHVWAEGYDRDLNDLFAIQEIAQKLPTTSTPSCRLAKASVEERPTRDLAAYDFMSALSPHLTQMPPRRISWIVRGVDLLNKAVARDPDFSRHCQLAFAHDLIYQQEIDHTSARFGASKGRHRFCISVEAGFGRSAPRAELASLLGIFPRPGTRRNRCRSTEFTNNPQAFELAGLIDRRRVAGLTSHAISSVHVSSILETSLPD